MPTTAEYLYELQRQKNNLVSNLNAKGVIASQDEKFNSLVPKVLDITGGSTSEFDVAGFFGDTLETLDLSGYNIKSLKSGAFLGSSINTIILPSTLEEIGSETFRRMPNLKSINLQDTKITVLPELAFYETSIGGSSLDLSKIVLFGDNCLNKKLCYTNSENIKMIGSNATYYLNYTTERWRDDVIITAVASASNFNNYKEDDYYCYLLSTNDKKHIIETKYSDKSTTLTLPEDTISIFTPYISSYMTEITLNDGLEYTHTSTSKTNNLTKINISSLDSWFSIDFGSFHRVCRDERDTKINNINNFNNWGTGSYPFCLSDNGGKAHLYVDGVQVDDITSLEVPETAGRGSLSSFSNLTEITLNIPDYFTGFPFDFGFYFGKKSASNKTSFTSYLPNVYDPKLKTWTTSQGSSHYKPTTLKKITFKNHFPMSKGTPFSGIDEIVIDSDIKTIADVSSNDYISRKIKVEELILNKCEYIGNYFFYNLAGGGTPLKILDISQCENVFIGNNAFASSGLTVKLPKNFTGVMNSINNNSQQKMTFIYPGTMQEFTELTISMNKWAAYFQCTDGTLEF